jgi:NADPH:quinone reductase-like Zn-dependent oxidoreductase
MKAAVMYQKGQLPQIGNMPEPVVKNDDEILVSVKAVAIKHFDKGRADGSHYSGKSPASEGSIIGGDGVCLLADGTKVYGIGVSGMLAERAVIGKDRIVVLPAGLDDTIAAALPNAVIGSAMGLRFKAKIQPGEIVLINGATGFTGRIAVQIAKHYGAGKVIVTGRNDRSLQELLSLGADEIISLKQTDENILKQIKTLHATQPIDIVIDYLWGHTAELILGSLKGNGSFTHKTRFVSIGSVTGDIVPLSAANLRSVDIELSGSGLGSWSKEQVHKLFSEILPEMLQLAADNKLKADVITANLKDIASLWELNVADGKRIVVTI